MTQKMDGIEFQMGEPFDFGFLERYGRVFKVFDDQDSGNMTAALCMILRAEKLPSATGQKGPGPSWNWRRAGGSWKIKL